MKKFLSLLLMSVLAFSVGWAAESAFYTLTPATGSNNAYASNCDIEISDITWNVSGNASLTPWRIGGKSLSDVDRTVYSKTAMGSAISKVSLEVGAASSITVNSLKLTVASDADFTNQLDEVTATFAANSTINFTPSSGSEWASNAYYKFTFNVTVSGSSNKYVEFKGATFYKNSGDDPQPSEFAAPTFSFTENSLVENGDAKIIMPENATSLKYWYGTDGNIAVLDRVDQTATADVVLDLSQFSLRDYVYVNAQAVYADGESSVVGSALYVGDPDYNFPLVFTAEPTEGGTITGPSTAQGGETVTFTVIPAEGYTLKNVTAKYTEFGNAYGGNDIVVGENSFTMPAYTKIDVTKEPRVFITATFQKEGETGSTATFVAGTDTSDDLTLTKSPVTLTLSSGTLSRTDNYRVYKNETITISVPEGYKINQIDFTGVSSNPASNFATPEVGNWSTNGNNGTWTGSAESVVLTASAAQVRLTQIDVTYGQDDPTALQVPEISGTTPFLGSTEVTITNPNETGEIRYTLDGSDPDANATLYSAPFSLTETTTVKAIVVDGTKTSSVAQKSFEALASVNSIAEFAATDGSVVAFANPVTVLGQNGSYLYVQDEGAAGMIIYGTAGQEYSFGDIIPAGFSGKYQLFRGMHEMTSPTGLQASTSTAAPEAIEVAPNEITTANSGRYAVIKGATFNGTNITVGENSVAIYNRFNITLPTDYDGKTYNVYGVTSMFDNAQFLPMSFEEVQAATYTITVAEAQNGTISDITAQSEKAGEPVMFQVTPDEHYAVDAVTVSCENIDLAVEVTDEGDGLYSFVMPADNVTISATFKQAEFLITISGANFTIEGVQNEQYVAAGEDVTFEVAATEGYQLDGVTISAGEATIEPEIAENMYSFQMPESNVEIAVATSSTAKTYPINVQAMENGAVVAEPAAAAIGQTVTLTVTPDEGYELETISVTAGYESQGYSGGGRAPSLKDNAMFMSQGNIELTKVEDNVYTFVLPEELPSIMTPNYVDNTEFRVNATFTQVVEPVAPLWVIGNVEGTGWQTESGIEMPFNTETEQYEVTVNVTGTDTGYFAIGTVLADNWNDFNAGRLTGAESGNFVVTADNHESITLLKGHDSSFQIAPGEYTLIIDKDLTTLQVLGNFPVKEEAYFLIGSFNGWDQNNQLAMTRNEDTGKFVAVKMMAANTELKLRDGDGTWYGAQADGNFIVTQEQVENGTEITILQGGGNNIQIPAAGEWTFTYDPANKTLVIAGEWPEIMTFAEAINDDNDGMTVQISNAIAISEYSINDGVNTIYFVTDNDGNYAQLVGNNDVAVPETGLAENCLVTYSSNNGNPMFTLLYGENTAMEYRVEKLSLIQQNADVYRPANLQVHQISGFFQIRDGKPILSQYTGSNNEVGATRDLNVNFVDISLDELTTAEPITVTVARVNRVADSNEPDPAGRRLFDAPETMVDYDLIVVDGNITVITGIDNVFNKVADAKAVRYFNLQGVESSQPFNGLNIVVIEHNDGTKTVQKAFMK